MKAMTRLTSQTVLITGATGMIGGLVLEQCLAAPEIERIISLIRQPTGLSHEKLQSVVVADFLDLGALNDLLADVDVVFYCLGAYTGRVTTEEMHRVTVDMPVHLVETLEQAGARPRFCLLSGAGADRSETSRFVFARDKGAVENFLSRANLPAFHTFRPAYIYPVTPRKEPGFSYRLMRMAWPLIRLMGNGASIRSTDLAAAMVAVGLNGHDQEVLENRDILACVSR